MNESYLEWKDARTAPFRRAWLESIERHEEQTDRFYNTHTDFLEGRVDEDKVNNAWNDKERARLAVNEAYYRYYSAAKRFDLNRYFQEQRNPN